MAYKNFVTLKDFSATPIWGGVEVLLLATSFKISGGIVLSNTEKTFQDTEITTVDSPDTLTDMKNNFNRRKSNVSYGGFSNSTISITCVFDNVKVGSTATINDVASKKIFTPSRLYEMILKPRTLYLTDELLVPLLQSAQDDAPVIYGAKGMPVLLLDWDIIPSLDGQQIVMSMKFREDKETA